MTKIISIKNAFYSLSNALKRASYLENYGVNFLAFAAMFILIAAGIATRFYHYIENYSLWLDEAMLAYNIVNVDFSELIGPLPFFSQTAPLLYLWTEKIFGSFFNYNEYSLRLVSLIGEVGSFGVLIYTLNRFYSPWAALIGSLLFSINAQSLRFSIELKHYSVEAMTAAIMIFLYVSAVKKGLLKLDFVLLSIFGAIFIWISNNSILILFSMGLILFALAVNLGSRKYRYVLLMGFIWIISFIFNYFFYTAESIKNQFSLHSHVYEAGYMPINSFSGALAWSWFRVKTVIYQSLSGVSTFDDYGIAIALVFLIIYAVLRNQKALGFIFVLFGTILALSAFRIYPFLPGRYTHFLQPIIIFATTIGMFQLFTDISSKWKNGFKHFNKPIPYSVFLIGLSSLAVFYFLVFNVISTIGLDFNRKIQETRPVIEYYKENKSDTDNIFVYYGSLPAFEYYTRNESLKFFGKIPYNSTVSWVSEVRGDFSSYLNRLELAIAKSNGMYFLISHARPNEKKQALDLMDKYGSVTVATSSPGAKLYYLKKTTK
jgi:hypothetical protein